MDVLRLREKSDGRCGPPPERGKLLGEICGLRVALLCGRIALLALARGLLFCGVQKHLGCGWKKRRCAVGGIAHPLNSIRSTT